MVSGMQSKIDFESNENIFLFSDKLSDQIENANLTHSLNELGLNSHIFILSSGTTQKSGLKGYALSKKAILANAKAVNDHLALDKSDMWLVSLPHYHIGGLSIYARSYLNGAKLKEFKEKWNVQSFYNALNDVTVVSVVPTQCYDIVQAKLSAPKDLRYLIVGGDYLNESLHRDLIQLGWPVIRTFGMTEVCSQLATEKEVSQQLSLRPLNIHQLSVDDFHRLKIKSPALFTGEFILKDGRFSFQKLTEDTYHSNDRVTIDGDFLYPQGRADEEIKINARRVDQFELMKTMKEVFYQNKLTQNAQFKLIKDVRDGYVIHISSLQEISNEHKEKIAKALKPLYVSHYDVVSHLNRTDLGKDKN